MQAVILRAGAAALGSLRNVISAHAEAAVSQCPERGWDKLLRFLCATANDCWQLVSDALPAVEERHPQAMSGENVIIWECSSARSWEFVDAGIAEKLLVEKFLGNLSGMFFVGRRRHVNNIGTPARGQARAVLFLSEGG